MMSPDGPRRALDARDGRGRDSITSNYWKRRASAETEMQKEPLVWAF